MMDALQLTKDLVGFASPSHISNREVSEFVASQLRSLGFDVELNEYIDAAGVDKVNVLGRKGPEDPASDSAAGLAYFCHSDVVPAETWTGPGSAFSATEHHGRLYGRGSCDMKGSAACMLSAIARLAETPLRGPLYFVCTADEEVAYEGAKHVVATSPMYREMVERQTRALVGEPTQLDVVHAHKGICKLQFISHGEAAHSSTRDGRNANLAMIPFLQEMLSIHDETESSSRWQNEEFDPPTLSWNIGINDHTKAVNVKAAQSICTVFYRPLPNVEDQLLIERSRAAAQRCGLDTKPPSRCGAVYTKPTTSFVQEALSIAGQSDAKTVAYGTDAGELTELQNKIICGPGSITQAHTTDEWLDVRQLEKGCELYEQFLRRWCVDQ